MKSGAALGLSIWMLYLASASAVIAGDPSQAHATSSQPTGAVTSTSTLRFEPPPPEPSPGSFGRPMVWGLPFWFALPPAIDDAKPVVTVAASAPAAVPAPAQVPVEPSSIQPPLRSGPPRADATARGYLRLRVTPATAQVYVDGFFTGTAEDGPGLSLAAGWHRIEFRASGHDTLAVNLTVEADRTVTWEGELRPLRR